MEVFFKRHAPPHSVATLQMSATQRRLLTWNGAPRRVGPRTVNAPLVINHHRYEYLIGDKIVDTCNIDVDISSESELFS